MGRWLLPEGVSDVLPQEAAQLERLRRQLLDLYRSYGYQLVAPPLLEYVESLTTGVGADLDLRTFKLVDQMSGRLLGLRADITPQVARIDAHILNRSGVVRLCYAASVVHAKPLHPLASREPYYIGAELYGHAGIAADLEVIELAALSLAQTRVAGVRFDVGHTGVLRAFLARDPAAQARADDIVAALSAKDHASLALLTEGLQARARDGLRALPRLHGPADLLEHARATLAADDAAVGRALDELLHLSQHLQRRGAGVGVDLADLHGYRYHTGATFAAFAPNWPVALLRGGRYDDVGLAFGRARPATGLSIDLRELTRLTGAGATRAILAPAAADDELSELVAQLRSAGEVVVQQLSADEEIDGLDCDRQLSRVDGRWQVCGRGAGFGASNE